MAVTLAKAQESDAARIADIHMSAFANNAMLLAQFPTPAVRKGLWTSLVRKAIAEIRDPQWEVLVVKNQQDGIISFAKWCLPIPESEIYEEPPWEWPDGTNVAVLDEWTKRVEAAGDKVIGDAPCYRLTFIATDPDHERLGAASMLMRWGLERSKRSNIPIALESTPNADAFYRGFGFAAEAEISMQLDGVGPGGASVAYEEKCYVFRPSAQARSFDLVSERDGDQQESYK